MHLHHHSNPNDLEKKVTCSIMLSFPLSPGQAPVVVPFECKVEYTQSLPGVDLMLPGPVVDHEICTDSITDIRLAVIQVTESADDATVKLNNGSPIPLIGFSPPEPQFVPRGPGFAPGMVYYYNPTGGLTSIKFNSAYAIKIKVSLFGT